MQKQIKIESILTTTRIHFTGKKLQKGSINNGLKEIRNLIVVVVNSWNLMIYSMSFIQILLIIIKGISNFGWNNTKHRKKTMIPISTINLKNPQN